METIDCGDLIQRPYWETLHKKYIYKSFCETKLIAKRTNYRISSNTRRTRAQCPPPIFNQKSAQTFGIN